MIEETARSAPSHTLSATASQRQAEVQTELAKFLPSIGKMSEQLKQTSAQIEESVVEVCASFQGIAERAKATVAKTTGFLSAGSDGPSNQRSFEELIENTGATLVKIMNSTVESGEISRRAVESVQQMDHASLQISMALGLLEELAKQNKMLALNARIEAAHAGVQGAGFEVVAIEVASQTQRSRDVSTKVGTLVDDLRKLASATLSDLRRMNERDAELVQANQREANDSLQNLRAAHDEMKGMLTEMTREGAALARDIGAAVRGMQFQDRVSQRIAHVVDELETLRSRLASAGDTMHPDADEASRVYTMREERAAVGSLLSESPGGDVELF